MANICGFEMMVIGEKDNIENFYKAMTQKDNLCMGRGADCDLYTDEYEEEGYAIINGWCKWSVETALINNAISMRTHPEDWSFGERKFEDLEFITLIEATKKFDLIVEVFSEEAGCGFMEHYIIKQGDILCDDCVDYYEHHIKEYATKEEAEEELGIEITDSDWAEAQDDGWLKIGGIEWDYTI